MYTVLVTGSSRGIGKDIAKKFNDMNYNIVLNCNNSINELNALVDKWQEQNLNVIGIKSDVSNYNSVDTMFSRIENTFGGVDILINNAGISYNGLFQDMKPSDWQRLMKINIESVFNCSHRAIPYMLKQKNGCIINISSIWGVKGASCESVYSASKGAINAFTTALAKELAPSGIRINSIACGVINTNMNNFMSEEEKNELANEIPLMRFGNPEEIANLVKYLASDDSQYIIGQTIIIDGGFI